MRVPFEQLKGLAKLKVPTVGFRWVEMDTLWTWPRTKLAKLVRSLKGCRGKVVIEYGPVPVLSLTYEGKGLEGEFRLFSLGPNVFGRMKAVKVRGRYSHDERNNRPADPDEILLVEIARPNLPG